MSCLFDSLSHFFRLDSNNIRQIICNYLANNQKIIDGLDTHFILSLDNTSPQQYINRMRMNESWGGGIEIQAACNIWKVTILVYNIRDPEKRFIEFVPVDGESRGVIRLSWNGSHFEPF